MIKDFHLNQIRILLIGILVSLSPSIAQTKIAVVQHPFIDEQSAIITSALYPDTYWVLNDSGDKARLFAIHQSGEVIIPPFLQKRYSDADHPYPGVAIYGATNED